MYHWLNRAAGTQLVADPSAKTVLIHADHRRRDAATAMLVAWFLRDLGYNTIVGNRLTSRDLCLRYRPEAVLLFSHPGGFLSPQEMQEMSGTTRFIMSHPESSGMIREAMVIHMRGGPASIGDAYTRSISRVITWGPLLADWIVDAGLYSKSDVRFQGCPRYDFYLGAEPTTKARAGVGAMSSFTGISNFNNSNPLENIHNGRGMHGVHYAAAGGYEDFLWAAAAFARIFFEFLDVWCLELGNRINFRPYTLENLADFDFYQARYGEQFRLDSQSPFPAWLSELSANVFCYSSSIIESIVSGVPYITIQEILGERLEYHQPRSLLPETRGAIYEFTYQPKSVPELIGLMEKAAAGDLGLRVRPEDSSALRRILSDYYGYPQARPASQMLAEEIADLLQGTPKSARRFQPLWIYRREQELAVWQQYSDRSFDDYHFLPWHQSEKEYARLQFKRLTRSRAGDSA